MGGSARLLLFPDLCIVPACTMDRCAYRPLAVPEGLPRYPHHHYVCAVSWAWVVFRAESLAQAVTIWRNLAHIPVEVFGYLSLVLHERLWINPLKALGLGWLIWPSDKISLMPLYVFALAAVYLVLSFRLRQQDDGPLFAAWNVTYRWSAYVSALVGILLLGSFGATTFIYFQF